MHEVITIQLGERANYTATHFWNTQVGMPSQLFSHRLLSQVGGLLYVRRRRRAVRQS